MSAVTETETDGATASVLNKRQFDELYDAATASGFVQVDDKEEIVKDAVEPKNDNTDRKKRRRRVSFSSTSMLLFSHEEVATKACDGRYNSIHSLCEDIIVAYFDKKCIKVIDDVFDFLSDLDTAALDIINERFNGIIETIEETGTFGLVESSAKLTRYLLPHLRRLTKFIRDAIDIINTRIKTTVKVTEEEGEEEAAATKEEEYGTAHFSVLPHASNDHDANENNTH